MSVTSESDRVRLGSAPESYGQHGRVISVTVRPVVAGHFLAPGARVGLLSENGEAVLARPGLPAIGIVDPFLTRGVARGAGFWLVMDQEPIV